MRILCTPAKNDEKLQLRPPVVDLLDHWICTRLYWPEAADKNNVKQHDEITAAVHVQMLTLLAIFDFYNWHCHFTIHNFMHVQDYNNLLQNQITDNQR